MPRWPALLADCCTADSQAPLAYTNVPSACFASGRGKEVDLGNVGRKLRAASIVSVENDATSWLNVTRCRCHMKTIIHPDFKHFRTSPQSNITQSSHENNIFFYQTDLGNILHEFARSAANRHRGIYHTKSASQTTSDRPGPAPPDLHRGQRHLASIFMDFPASRRWRKSAMYCGGPFSNKDQSTSPFSIVGKLRKSEYCSDWARPSII